MQCVFDSFLARFLRRCRAEEQGVIHNVSTKVFLFNQLDFPVEVHKQATENSKSQLKPTATVQVPDFKSLVQNVFAD